MQTRNALMFVAAGIIGGFLMMQCAHAQDVLIVTHVKVATEQSVDSRTLMRATTADEKRNAWEVDDLGNFVFHHSATLAFDATYPCQAPPPAQGCVPIFVGGQIVGVPVYALNFHDIGTRDMVAEHVTIAETLK